MSQLVIFIIGFGILGIATLINKSKEKDRKEYYLSRATEYSMKGEDELAEKYIMLASRIR